MRSAVVNRAIVASAGSRKTQLIIDGALSDPGRRVLITTYTQENLSQIVRRILEVSGIMPEHITVMTWFSFLINQTARPFQQVLTGEIDFARSLNFVGRRSKFVRRDDIRRYYFDRNRDMYRDGVSDFACRVDEASGGAVIRRLETIYDHIYVDEFQDLDGYDLDFIDRVFASDFEVTDVGEPRQHTVATNNGSRNKKYRAAGVISWFRERESICALEVRAESWRCNQIICDWSDWLYPTMPATASRQHVRTGHDGIFRVARDHVPDYFAKYRPQVLRDSRVTPTLGLPAINIGVAKGSTYDRVLIFPTKPMLKYLMTADLSALRAVDRLYVAVTRAKYSVAFVVERKDADYLP